MKKLFICIMLLGFTLQTFPANNVRKGWYNIHIKRGKLTLFKGTKECYLFINSDRTEIHFGSKHDSEYHIRIKFIKPENK